MLDGGNDHLVDEHGLLADAEHMRNRVSVDVRIQHADLFACLGERDGEIRSQRRFADPALAAADGEHACRRVERESLRALL